MQHFGLSTTYENLYFNSIVLDNEILEDNICNALLELDLLIPEQKHQAKTLDIGFWPGDVLTKIKTGLVTEDQNDEFLTKMGMTTDLDVLWDDGEYILIPRLKYIRDILHFGALH